MPVADDELRLGLEAVLRRPVAAVSGRGHPYGSSHALEDLDVTFAAGDRLALVLKDVSAPAAHARAAKPVWMRDPDREVEAYRDVLLPRGVDVPACYGMVGRDGRRWLLLESVDGVPLWQADGPAAWQAAARWLADLHARPATCGARHQLTYGPSHLHAWLARAVALLGRRALAGVAAVWERVVRCLSSWRQSVVHGDFYPSNILVERGAGPPRIRPVDWELAGVGPGLLDLAALTSGEWTSGARDAVVLAYQQALPAWLRPGLPALTDALDHGRLFLAVQWLGWSPEWSPPEEHAHDWLTEATTLARRLAP